MSGLKLLKIVQNPEYETLLARHFINVRNCGHDVEGMLISLTVGYIDSMILSQSTKYNNYIFSEPM